MVARGICFIRRATLFKQPTVRFFCKCNQFFVPFDNKKRSAFVCASVFFILLHFLVILGVILHLFRKLENQFFGVLPAEARIGNGFAVHAAVGRLRAFFDVGLDHQTFDDCTDVG